jgi:hypothetical protein
MRRNALARSGARLERGSAWNRAVAQFSRLWPETRCNPSGTGCSDYAYGLKSSFQNRKARRAIAHAPLAYGLGATAGVSVRGTQVA